MKLRSASAAAAMLIASGCGSGAIESRVSPGVSLASYRTFSWQPSSRERGLIVTLADQQIHASLLKYLAAKGFTSATADHAPDFLVDYDVDERGTLEVKFADARNRSVFWKASAPSVVKRPDNPRSKAIERKVSQIVSRYPLELSPLTQSTP